MTRQDRIFQEKIDSCERHLLQEFPLLEPWAAEELAYHILEPEARENILGILRMSGIPATNEIAGMVIERINRYDIERPPPDDYDEDEDQSVPDGGFEDTLGFTETWTHALTLACSATAERSTGEIAAELDGMDDWISMMDEMGLAITAATWSECLEQRKRWQENVMERLDNEATAALLGQPGRELARWTSGIKAQQLGRWTIAAIETQEDLAAEAAAVDPDFYRRYLGECARNRSKPFSVIDNRTGETRKLCLLRFKKDRWYLAQPTFHNTREDLLQTLQDFAKEYHKKQRSKTLNRNTKNRSTQNQREDIQCTGCSTWMKRKKRQSQPAICSQCVTDTAQALEKAMEGWPEDIVRAEIALFRRFPNHRCLRCSPRQEEPQGSNTPARCIACRDDYRARFDEPTHVRHQTCQSCGGDQGAFAARRDNKRGPYTLCTTCLAISRDHPVFPLDSNIRMVPAFCPSCNAPIERDVYNQRNASNCQKCQKEIEEERRLRYNRLRDWYTRLRERDSNNVPDNPDRRPDANPGRLNPALAAELCREYVQEKREIPELALRFEVSLAVVRNTLGGSSWNSHTQGARPARLRAEPEGVNRLPPRPREAKPREPKPARITVSRLRSEFGWTDTLIARHLGEPDAETPNPHYRSAAPMRLYLLDRVYQTTAGNPTIQQQLQKQLEGRASRQKRQKELDQARQSELLRTAEKLQPRMVGLPTTDPKALVQMAARARSEFLEYYQYDEYDQGRPVGLLEAKNRAVNMVRHEFTNYEQLLEEMPRSRNLRTNLLVYQSVKRRTLEMVREHLPELANACNWQIKALEDKGGGMEEPG